MVDTIIFMCVQRREFQDVSLGYYHKISLFAENKQRTKGNEEAKWKKEKHIIK